jgi:hypothetical protein
LKGRGRHITRAMEGMKINRVKSISHIHKKTEELKLLLRLINCYHWRNFNPAGRGCQITHNYALGVLE